MEMYSTLNKNIVTLAVDSIEYEAFIGHSLPFSEELSAVKVVNGIIGIAVVVKFLQKNQYISKFVNAREKGNGSDVGCLTRNANPVFRRTSNRRS